MVLDILDREDGKVIIVISNVIKVFRGAGGSELVSRLRTIYNLLSTKRVPNVDSLDRSYPNHSPPYVHLSPVGSVGPLNSGFDAFRAVVSVLEALEVHHHAS